MGLGDWFRKAFSGSGKTAPQKGGQAGMPKRHKLVARKQATRTLRGGKNVSKVMRTSRSRNSSLKFRVG